jgi:hypothetical protein
MHQEPTEGKQTEATPKQNTAQNEKKSAQSVADNKDRVKG